MTSPAIRFAFAPLFCGAVLYCGSLSAQTAKEVVVTKEALQIDGTAFSSTSALGHFERVLGKVDRTAKKASTIYTFDDDGIYLYLGRIFIDSVVIQLEDKQPYDFSPKSPFKGTFKIGETVLSHDTSKAALLEVPGLKTESPTPSIVKATYGRFSMLMMFRSTDDQSKLDSVSITLK